MKKKHLSQALASATALSLLVGQVPTPAIAEAIREQGDAVEQQVAATDEGDSEEASSSDESGADASLGKKDEAAADAEEGASNGGDAVSDSAAKGSEAGSGASATQPSDGAPAQDGQQDDDGVATYAARASRNIRKAGSEWDEITKFDVYTAAGAGIRRIRPKASTGDWTEITSWAVAISDSADLEPGTYDVQVYKKTGGSFFNPKMEWVADGTLTLQRYWNATVTTSGAEGGAIVVDGADVTGTYQIDEGATKTFTPKAVEDYKVVSVKVNGAEATKNSDGSYNIPSNADSAIAVEYAADNSATVTVTGENLKAVTVGGSALGQGGQVAVNAKTPGTVVATPADGYAVTGITFDGASLDVTYANCVATAALPNNLVKDSSHVVEVQTIKSGLVAKGDTVDVGIAGKSESEYAGIIFDAAVDADASVPAGLTVNDVKVEYDAGGATGWKSLDYEPNWLEKLGGAHAFKDSEGSSEQIRISYAGTNQYPASSIELTVNVVDGRIATYISMNSATSVRYDADFDAMKQAVFNQLAPTVVDMNTGKPVNGLTIDDFEISGLEQQIGEQTVTVKFKGNKDYKPNVDEATATVTVTKAPSTLNVDSKRITYGSIVSIDDLVSSTPSNAETQPITVIAGIDGDAAGYLSIDLGYLGHGIVQGTINSILHLDEGVSLNDLLDNLNNDSTLTALKVALKVAGVEDPDAVIDSLKTVLSTVQGMGLGNSTIALGGTPTKAGVYLVGSVTSSANYETSVAMGYLTIAPDTQGVELSWNSTVPEGDFSYNGGNPLEFDFGAAASKDGSEVAANVRVEFVGVTYAGETYVSSEAPTEPGHYSETAYVLGGNYFADPIARTFKINRMTTSIAMADGNYEYDGAAQTLDAVVNGADGNPIEGAQVTYSYLGMNAAGKFEVKLDGAPTNAGTYLVLATYAGDATHEASSKTGMLYINPRPISMELSSMPKIYGEDDPALRYQTADAGQTEWKGSEGMLDLLDRYENDGTITEPDAWRDEGEEPGDYTIHGEATCSDKNFSLTVVPGTFTIYPSFAVNVDGNGGTATATYDGYDYVGGPAGTVVELDAEAAEGYVFTGWTASDPDAVIDSAASAQTAVVTSGANVTVTAHFALKWTPVTPMVKVTTDHTEGGQATSNPHGALPGTTVTITATPDEGYEFTGWKVISGDVELADPSAAETTFVLGEEPTKIQATFKRKAVPAEVKTTEGGTVNVTDENGNPLDTSDILPGTKVYIHAQAQDGYTFDNWEVVSQQSVLALFAASSAPDTAVLDDPSSPDTWFIMPKTKPVIVAHFKKASVTPVTPVDPGKKGEPTTDPSSDVKKGTDDQKKASETDAKKGTTPQTGDHSMDAAPLAIGGAAVLAAGAAAAAVAHKRRRDEE